MSNSGAFSLGLPADSKTLNGGGSTDTLPVIRKTAGGGFTHAVPKKTAGAAIIKCMHLWNQQH